MISDQQQLAGPTPNCKFTQTFGPSSTNPYKPTSNHPTPNPTQPLLTRNSLHPLPPTPPSQRSRPEPGASQPGDIQNHRRALARRDGREQGPVETASGGRKTAPPAQIPGLPLPTPARRQGRRQHPRRHANRRRDRGSGSVSQVRGTVYRYAADARGGGEYGHAVPVYGWDAWAGVEGWEYGEWV